VPETVDDWEREVTAAGPEFFIQVYVNVVTGTQNCVLVLGRQRLYARDCVGGVWHRHPYDDPDAHDFSSEGARPVTMVEFLIEVQELVEEAGLL